MDRSSFFITSMIFTPLWSVFLLHLSPCYFSICHCVLTWPPNAAEWANKSALPIQSPLCPIVCTHKHTVAQQESEPQKNENKHIRQLRKVQVKRQNYSREDVNQIGGRGERFGWVCVCVCVLHCCPSSSCSSTGNTDANTGRLELEGISAGREMVRQRGGMEVEWEGILQKWSASHPLRTLLLLSQSRSAQQEVERRAGGGATKRNWWWHIAIRLFKLMHLGLLGVLGLFLFMI